MAGLKRYMIKSRYVIYWSSCPKGEETSQQLMSSQYVQYSNEKLSLHDDWNVHIIHQPIENRSTGRTGSCENHFYLKHTDLKNLDNKTCCRWQYPRMNTTHSHYKMILSDVKFSSSFFFLSPKHVK